MSDVDIDGQKCSKTLCSNPVSTGKKYCGRGLTEKKHYLRISVLLPLNVIEMCMYSMCIHSIASMFSHCICVVAYHLHTCTFKLVNFHLNNIGINLARDSKVILKEE